MTVATIRNPDGRITVPTVAPSVDSYSTGGTGTGGGGTGDVTTAQLNAAIATVNAAVANKQDLSSAATDTELANAVATINTALAGKALSTDLTNAVNSLNAAVAGKQDAATAATDAEVASALSTLATAAALANEISRAQAAEATFQPANTAATDVELSNALAGKVDVTADKGREINSVILTVGAPNSADALENDIPGASLLVPANSGPAELLCPAGVFLTAITGTNASTVSQSVRVWIRDEANNLIAYNAWNYYGTGVSQTLNTALPIGALIPNNAADKTYRLRWQVQRHGTLGASGQVIFGGIFGPLFFRATAR